MRRIPSIKAVMTPFPFWVEADADLPTARRMMDDHDIHHLPVKEHGALIGVISARDIDTAHREQGEHQWVVRDLAVMPAYTVDLEESLDNVLKAMAEQHIGSVLVLKKDRLAGLFTTNDACRLFAEMLRDGNRPDPGDAVA